MLRRTILAMLAFACAAADATTDELDAFVGSVMASTLAPGVAVAVVRAGAPPALRSWGHDGTGRAIDADTPFWIGSNTKSLTALLVLQQVEAGRIELDAPVQRYLPSFRLADPAAAGRFTVRQLLHQTSGLPRASGLIPVLEGSKATGAQLLEQLRTVELAHPPGTAFEYCNWNFVLLGQIVAAVTGRPWADVLQASVLEPLAMTRTFTDFAKARAAGMTRNHRYAFGLPVHAPDDYLPGFAPTGYVAASARDMARYLAALQRGGRTEGGDRILDAALTAERFTGASPPGRSTLLGQAFEFRYGMGWFVGPFGAAERAYWHLGTLDSFSAWMAILPEHDLAVAVMVNANTFLPGADADLGRLGPGVVNVLLGAKAPEAPSLRGIYAVVSVVLAIAGLFLVLLIRRAALGRTGLAGAAVSGGIGAALLLGWPILNGLSWSTTLRLLPDPSSGVLVLGLGMLLVAALSRRRTSEVTH